MDGTNDVLLKGAAMGRIADVENVNSRRDNLMDEFIR
jgi:hypothetical protein